VSAPPWPSGPAADEGLPAKAGTVGLPVLVPEQGYIYIGGALMLACLGLHIWAMFPAYPGLPPTPVLSLPHDVAMYVCLEIGWALAAVLVLARISIAGGVALAAGLGAVELGLLLTDLIEGSELHTLYAPGGWLALAGLGAGLAGALFGASSVAMGSPGPGANPPSLGRAVTALPVTTLGVVTFWVSWQTGRVVYTNGLAAPINGDALVQPFWPLMASLLVGFAIGLVVIVAAWWTRPGVGAWAMVGVAISMASQLAAALVEVHEPLGDAVNGGVAKGLDVARSSISLTADWGFDVVAVVALLALAVWAALDSRNTDAANGPLDVDGLGGPGDEALEQWPAGHRWPQA
jgi:hypothetical protein